ncbi:uncharacterized protein [Spinacia oleracea]|uniref:RNase H type-1 domain-containing protein n=1 Tax=Spinacia oleracea TaxID=3562 RepID=A0ABM3QQA9_SPIOL|nr:uncharacterized protein LOC130461457 [Spinacia oleracea]
MLLSNYHNAASSVTIPSASWWKHFWGLKVLPRFKIFFWKLVRDVLPLASLLCHRGMPVDPLCSLCHQDLEVSSHLFRDCPLLLNLWSLGPLRPFCPSSLSGSFVHWCLEFLNNLSLAPVGLLDLFFSMLWTIWSLRNSARFRNVVWDPGAFIAIVDVWRGRCSEVRSLHQRTVVRHRCLGAAMSSASFVAVCPSSAVSDFSAFDICVICDGAWMSSSNEGGLGWILQNPSTSAHVGGGAQACVLASALQAELSACLWGVRMAICRGYSRILVYTDSSSVVALLSGTPSCPIQVFWLVCQLRELLQDLSRISIRKVPRAAVKPAHTLATSARRRHLLHHRF